MCDPLAMATGRHLRTIGVVVTLLVLFLGGTVAAFALIPADPPVHDTAFVQLSGVACPTTHVCWTVGVRGKEDDQDPEDESFAPYLRVGHGTVWTDAPLAAVPGDDVGLYAIACPTATECLAVGGSNGGSLIEQWDGRAWTRTGPSVPNGALESISCSTARDCVAVGAIQPRNADGDIPLYLRLHAGRWASLQPPSPVTDLFRVWCSAAEDCWATAETSNGDDDPVIHRHDGRWTLCAGGEPPAGISTATRRTVRCLVDSDGCFVTASVQEGPARTEASGCGEPNTCWRVSPPADPPIGLRRWDGSRWTTTQHPEPGGVALGDVGCASSTLCWAVGPLSSLPPVATPYQAPIRVYSGLRDTALIGPH